MPKIVQCRHGKNHYEHCDRCAVEHKDMEQYRRRRKQTEDALTAKAKAVGRNQTIIDTDGCEVTATPDGHVFYNAEDWW